MAYSELENLKIVDKSSSMDLLSLAVWPMRTPTPGWSGVMQMCHDGSYPGQSSITFLPMIDMSPSDPTCIYSTMMFVCEHSQRYGSTPVLTFDQPLYWKAHSIINSEPQNSPVRAIVLRLGGFHAQMSFLGCIGHIMSGSGLRQLIETVYAGNAVTHMLSGKAVSRAVRAHFLVDTAIHALLVSRKFGIDLPPTEAYPKRSIDVEDQEDAETASNALIVMTPTTVNEQSKDTIMEKAAGLYDQLLKGDVSVEHLCEHEVLLNLQDELSSERNSLQLLRTATLWLQYSDMIAILKRFIKAERTGNWSLHLSTLFEMLPYFAASGHNLYAKSAYMYLTDMLTLQQDHPDVYSAFSEGHHVMRRSNRYWAGISSDLVIEQVLMRSVKASGGMTRGRGMSETQRAKWLLSMPACADVNNAMQKISNVGFHTSEQHKEATNARKEKDRADVLAMLSFLSDRSPFSDDPALRNIENGIIAEQKVNVDNALKIGSDIIQSMAGHTISEFTFRKANQVVTMNAKTSVKVDGETINIDPQLLFQRLTTVANSGEFQMSEVMRYELCGYPSSLFDASGVPREASKSALADAIWSMGDCAVDQTLCALPLYILDGGSLIQRLPWTKDASFSTICSLYVDYIKRKYDDAIVVFDGYPSGPTTKDVTHLRRSKGKVYPKVNFTEDMPCKLSKELFLGNTENKQAFINLLSSKLRNHNVPTNHASADADRCIVETAVRLTSTRDVVIIGEDTDLLVLLCFYARLDDHELHFRSVDTTKHKKVWDIKKTKLVLGQEICQLLPAIHAITGCDSTSRFFGIGKGAALKRIRAHQEVKNLLKVFLDKDSSGDTITKTGEAIITFLYGCAAHEGLDILRCKRFAHKTMTASTCIQVQTLPQTSDAASFHSQRAYLQCQHWIRDKKEIELDPSEWGWYIADNTFSPKRTPLPPAPDTLLQVVRCNCKINCDSKRCTCRKHGIVCSIACGECSGVSCSNGIRSELDTDEESDDQV